MLKVESHPIAGGGGRNSLYSSVQEDQI